MRIWGRQAGNGSRGFVSLAVVGTLLLAAVAVVAGTGNTRAVIDVLDGVTWLGSSERGELALVNGAAARTEVRLRVKGARGQQLRIAQNGRYLVFADGGSVSSVDLSSFKVTRTTDFGDGRGLRIVLGKRAAFAVDTRTGSVQAIDPGTTVPRGRPLQLGGKVAVGGIDDRDQVWLGQLGSGQVLPIASRRTGAVAGDRVQVAEPGDAFHVAVADGRPVVVNETAGVAARLEGGRVVGRFRLPVTTGTPLVMATDSDDQVVPVAVPSQNDLILVGPKGGRVVDLGPGRARLGPPVRFAGKTYVPHYGRGVVLEVTDDGVVTQEIEVPGGKGGFELLRDDAHVWANAATNPMAKNVDRHGHVQIIEKYSRDALVADADPAPEAPPDAPVIPVRPTPGRGPSAPGAGGGPGSGPGTGPGTGPPLTTSPTPTTSPRTSPTTAPPTSAPPTTPPPGAPGQPVGLRATAASREITLGWSPPADNGSAITAYTIAWRTADGPVGEVTIGAAQTDGGTGDASATVSDGPDGEVRNGVTYTVSVAATNDVGTGPPAESGPVTPTNATPSAPTALTASAAIDGSVTLDFTPGDGEGHRVIGYDVTAIPTAGGDAVVLPRQEGPPIVVPDGSGLAYGAEYSFEVRTVSDATPDGALSDPAGASATPYTSASGVTLQVTRTTAGPKHFEIAATPTWRGREGTVKIGGVASGTASGSGSLSFAAIDPPWGTRGTVTVEACVADDDGIEQCTQGNSVSIDARAPVLTTAPRLEQFGCENDPNGQPNNRWGRVYQYLIGVETYGVPSQFFTGYSFTWTYWRGGNSGSQVTNTYQSWSGRTIGGSGDVFVHGGWGQDTDRYFLTARVSVDGLGQLSSSQSDGTLADCAEDGPGRGT